MGIKIQKYSRLVNTNYYFSKRMHNLGIPKQYTAYYYLMDIMDLLINQNKSVKSFSREVYPEIAIKYNKTDCTVERDIRSVINVFWEKSLKNSLSDFWHYERKPRCREFIYLVKNYLIMDIA